MTMTDSDQQQHQQQQKRCHPQLKRGRALVGGASSVVLLAAVAAAGTTNVVVDGFSSPVVVVAPPSASASASTPQHPRRRRRQHVVGRRPRTFLNLQKKNAGGGQHKHNGHHHRDDTNEVGAGCGPGMKPLRSSYMPFPGAEDLSRDDMLSAAVYNRLLTTPTITKNDQAADLGELQQQQNHQNDNNDWMRDFAVPVVSSALLITGNTVGAGSLVMPELAHEVGMATTTALFGGAWLVNLVSGLVLAEVAIKQRERCLVSSGGVDDCDAVAMPSSFKEFAQANLGERAGVVISGISLFVNSCVMSFAFGRAGTLGAAMLNGNGAVVAPAGCDGIDPAVVSAVWAAGVLGLFMTQTSQKLSSLASFCVTALFVSFAGLLLPGLGAMDQDPMTTLLQPGVAVDLSAAVGHVAPVILMSMVYQNVIPTLTKNLDYDRSKTVASIVLGSVIPPIMYLAWCMVCMGGGVEMDCANGCNSELLTMFSVATLAGSSLGSGLSLSEELESTVGGGSDATDAAAATPAAPEETSSSSTETRFKFPSVLLATGVPLAAAVAFSTTGQDMTAVLSVAGSFGSPLLYGVLPAAMAWSQRQQQAQLEQQQQQQQLFTTTTTQAESLPPSQPQQQDLVPAASLAGLGLLSTGFVGEELFQRVGDVLA